MCAHVRLETGPESHCPSHLTCTRPGLRAGNGDMSDALAVMLTWAPHSSLLRPHHAYCILTLQDGQQVSRRCTGRVSADSHTPAKLTQHWQKTIDQQGKAISFRDSIRTAQLAEREGRGGRVRDRDPGRAKITDARHIISVPPHFLVAYSRRPRAAWELDVSV